jgi:hypothetical protein
VITGFNTDVEHEGITYHVQTEDKGLKSPLILSLVYVGGTILASKRTPYDDLISTGFEESKLAERLQRQHKLICAAIHAGRIEDLKRQTEREATARSKPAETAEPKTEAPEIDESVIEEPESEAPGIKEPEVEAVESVAAGVEPESEVVMAEAPVAVVEDLEIIRSDDLADFMPPSIYTMPPVVQPQTPVVPSVSEAPAVQPPEQVDYSRVVDYQGSISQEDDLQIVLVDEKRFVAGEFVKVNVCLMSATEGRESISDVPVTLKVLGSSFRPLIFSGKTAPDGTATFYAMLPYFTSGRAAILVNAIVKGRRIELRRVIHQA